MARFLIVLGLAIVYVPLATCLLLSLLLSLVLWVVNR